MAFIDLARKCMDGEVDTKVLTQAFDAALRFKEGASEFERHGSADIDLQFALEGPRDGFLAFIDENIARLPADQGEKLRQFAEEWLAQNRARLEAVFDNSAEATDIWKAEIAERRRALSDKHAGLIVLLTPEEQSPVRLDQLEAVSADLEAGKPVLLKGLSSMGKSTFSYSLKGVFEGETMMNIIGDYCKPGSWFLREASDLMSRESGRDKREVRKEMEEKEEGPIFALNEALASSGKKAILVVDEMDITDKEGSEHEKAFQKLAALSNVRLLVNGQPYGYQGEQAQRLFGNFETHWLRPLSTDETALVVRKFADEEWIKITDEAVKEIQRITGGRPKEVNLLMSYLFDPEKYADQRDALKNQFVEEDISRLFECVMGDEFREWKPNERIFQYVEQSMRPTLMKLPESEREVLKRLATTNTVPISKLDDAVAQQLINLSFIVQEGDKYRINGEFLRWAAVDTFGKHEEVGRFRELLGRLIGR